MLTAEQITDLLANIDRGGLKGRVMAARRSGLPADTLPRSEMVPDAKPGRGAPIGGGGSGPSPAQKQLLDDLDELASNRQPEEVYQHPGSNLPGPSVAPTVDANGLQTGHQVQRTELSDADIAWISRLSSDPSQVSWADARSVLALRQNVDPRRADQVRLLDSIARPLDDWHTTNQALSELRNARQSVAPIPSSAIAAMADAVQHDIPQLRPDEAAVRASDQVASIGAARTAAHAQRLADAEAALQAIGERAEARKSPTRTAAPTEPPRPGDPGQVGRSAATVPLDMPAAVDRRVTT